ncbi:hypothetical protein AALO_G00003940 [Alosa alosa]|uniref:Uncharacterized protein n=1 Tax=Alosa alosa TaxID=278164 RepID=A0AAV6HHU0_9TELE|nr:mucin-5AC [Alosa alosa]KAG5285486.1 hypothetical protein AALO_G00003940 [Alosa alosa]
MKHRSATKETPMNMKTTSYIFVGVLVILSNSGKLSGQSTDPPHTEPPTVQSDVGAPHSITISPSSPRMDAGEVASSAPPHVQTSHHAATLPYLSEATYVTALSPELSSVSGGRTDTATLHTTASLHTLSVLPQNDSSLSPKTVPFIASTADATSVPPGKGIAPTELTTPAASPNQTESNHLNTDPSTLAILPTQTTPESTHIPVSSQTTHQPTSKSVPEGTAVEITSLPPTPSPTQLLTSEAPQAPGHLSVAPPKQEEPPQLDVGDEDAAHEGHHPASPLDPILAGLVSIFIVCTAIASVLLFLKFRHRNEHPEFHRLHDLPMDDLLEDTPLSRYTY